MPSRSVTGMKANKNMNDVSNKKSLLTLSGKCFLSSPTSVEMQEVVAFVEVILGRL